MLPVFLTPWALAGLLAATGARRDLLGCANRFRRQPVSSLMLWLHRREARAGGLRVQRLQTPLLFFLELAALLLLTVAAASPENFATASGRPLIVVLDDSFSMRAGGDDSARNRAAAAILDEVRRRWAGAFCTGRGRAPALGQVAHRNSRRNLYSTVGAAEHLRRIWPKPSASVSNWVARAQSCLSLAIMLPTSRLEKGRVRSRASASRSPMSLLSTPRAPQEPASACCWRSPTLGLRPGPHPSSWKLSRVPSCTAPTWRLRSGETRRIVLKLAEDAPTVHARLGPDVLDTDNRVTLLAEPAPPVRVAVTVGDERLRKLWVNALKATRRPLLTEIRPDAALPIGQRTHRLWAKPGQFTSWQRRRPTATSVRLSSITTTRLPKGYR